MPDDPVDNAPPRPRGRPRGSTDQGAATRQRLYETALRQIGERGWEGATLRDVAREAGVSPGLLYRYFPSKRAVVLELYDRLSAEYAERASEMRPGRWRHRVNFALATSLHVLRPHRAVLLALVPTLVSTSDDGVLAGRTSFSRERVQAAFTAAVSRASDAPDERLSAALGRLLYLLHLAVILWWLLDKSPEQRATDGLLALLSRAFGLAAPIVRLPPARRMLLDLDALVTSAFMNAGGRGAYLDALDAVESEP